MQKPSHQIRRENFAAEVERAGGIQAFADAYPYSTDYTRQLLNGKDGGGRNIGDRSARKIEVALGKGENWLDQDWALVPEGVGASPSTAKKVSGDGTKQARNDVDALRYAVSALFTMIAAERPGEAARLAEVIRGTVPVEFVENGIVRSLVSKLEKGARLAKPRQRRPSDEAP